MKKIMNNKLKKVCALLLISICTLGLTGCGEKLKEFANNDLNYAITGRISQNQEMLEKLYNNGFISDETYKIYNDSMNSMILYYRSEILNVDVDGNGNVVNCPYLKAVHQIRDLTPSNIKVETVTDDNGKVVNVNNASLNTLILSNYLLDHNFSDLSSSDAEIYTNSGVEPLAIIDDDITKDMTERFACPVYVLNWDLVTRDGNASLDEVINAVNNAITTNNDGSRNIDTSILSKYFKKAVDDSGNAITLMNDFDKDGNGDLDFNMVKVTEQQDSWTQDETSNKQGYDLIVYQYDTPSFTIQFKEFDPNAFAIIESLAGLNNSKYIYSKENGGAFYVMEYPVWYLESIRNESENSKTVIGEFNESGIGVNLYTQKIIKYEPIYNGEDITWSKVGSEISELIDSYLTVAGADNQNFDGKSAFIVNGTQDIDVSFSINTTANNITNSEIAGTVKGARIILRDYLEATYAPKFVKEGDLVVFGRKIRFLFKQNNFNSDGNVVINKNEDIAVYVDKDGNNIYNGNYLRITDFCSAESLIADDKFWRLNETSEYGTQERQAQNVISGEVPTIEQIYNVGVAGTTPIKPTLMFPGDKIGTADYGDHGSNDNNSKQRFYAIATRKGLFNSGLYSNWINITDKEASLDWWNEYLNDNKFVYSVGHQKVNDYLLGNYGYEISQTGVVVIDLDVVNFIQEEMNEKNQTETAEFTRTIFIILGWILACYAILLMIAWVIDTNLDLGFDLLSQMTFGNWVAIKYAEDIPKNDLSNTKYMSLSGVVISSFIITAIGILLITVDIYSIVIMFIRMFGGIASQIQHMLSGI